MLIILIVVEDKRKLPSRKGLITSLAGVFSPWSTQFDEVMLLNFESGVDVRSDWNAKSNFLEQKLANNQILSVHSASSLHDKETISSIIIEEVDNQSVISIAIEANQIVLVPTETVQGWIIRLHDLVSSYTECIIAAGSELGFDLEGKTMDQYAELLTSPFMSAFWMVIPNNLHLNLPDNVEVMELSDSLLLQRRNLISNWFRV